MIWSKIESSIGVGLESLFVLRQEYGLPKGKELILKKLESSDFSNLNVQRLSENEFRLSARVSLGVGGAVEAPSFFQPIAVNAVVHISEDNEARISFNSEIRVELVVIGLAWLVVIAWVVVLWFSDDSWHPEALIAFGILPVVWLWFRFVYRVQEEQIVNSVLKQLRQS